MTIEKRRSKVPTVVAEQELDLSHLGVALFVLPRRTVRENRALFHGPSVAVVAIALAVPAANSARKRPGFF